MPATVLLIQVLKVSRRQNSVKCSGADNHVKVLKSSDVSGTVSFLIFRVLLMAW